MAEVCAASEAGFADAARIADAGAARRASHMNDASMRRAVVSRLSAPKSPVFISGGDSGEQSVVRPHIAPGGPVVAAAVAPVDVPTGRVDSRGFAIHRHPQPNAQQPPIPTIPPKLCAELLPSMTADVKQLLRLPVGAHGRGQSGPPMPPAPPRPPTPAGLPPRVVAAIEREFAQMGLETGSPAAPRGAAEHGAFAPGHQAGEGSIT